MDDTPYAISFVHARGLRRDLFRMIDDRTRKAVPAFEKCWDILRLPYRSVRDANAVFDRTKRALQACAYGRLGKARDLHGLILQPTARVHADGLHEPIIEVRTVSLRIRRGIPSGSLHTIGTVSHHAIERMFQRMNTMSKEEVLDDILAFSVWTQLLQTVAIVSGPGRRIEQLPLPTPHGIFLCVRETDTWEVHMRTWIPHGMSARHDASVASIIAFCQDIKADLRTMVDTFDAMAQRPENLWWRTPHRDAERCPYA
jgi:hypothetical protein